ncbi:DUF4190 domain-containing protein [Nocardioides donggukensis]|uniref:DUF4190 domain-containing protein n=1 Tax=Nocardioides donggukensis TaxID=2774019 RepID=A0A927K1Z2_9ACTN|nr:DUF4190 domain-containing protein [Nocardioides donggukensis]MBD8868932.1 DUF4190 domain-containing protein [Nocardioides donggukensis]
MSQDPAWPSAVTAPRRTNGLAIVGFVLNLTPMGLVLPGWVCAVIGLRQIRRDGTRGRWAAVTALVMGAVWAVAITVAVALVVYLSTRIVSPEDLEAGTCVSSDDIADGSESIGLITEADCDEEHDGEVYAIHEITRGEAKGFTPDTAGEICYDELIATGVELPPLGRAGLAPYPILSVPSPGAGDLIACTLRQEDGERLDRRYVDRPRGLA